MIKVNDGNNKVFNTFSLYTGVSSMKVVAICPILDELVALGFAFKKEPEYLTTSPEGTTKLRLDLIFKNDKMIGKAAFFLENKQRNTKENADRYEWTNNLGENAWANSPQEAMDAVYPNSTKKCLTSNAGLRKALVGEVEFIKFIRDWCNANKEDEVTLDYTQLFKGNLKELQDTLRDCNKIGNEIYTLSLVSDDKYQQIYTGCFVRQQFSLANALTRFKTHITKQNAGRYAIKEAWTLEFKEHTPKMVSPDPEPAEKHDEPNF